jgi:TPR repeat protein
MDRFSMKKIIFALVMALLSIGWLAIEEQKREQRLEAQLSLDRCETDEGLACWKAASVFEEHGDFEKANELYKKSCGLNIDIACLKLGQMYESGEIVQQSGSKAEQFYEKACSLDQPIGCSRLGLMYLEGKGVTLSYWKASVFLAKACRFDDALGCFNLGLWNERALGGKKNYENARALYAKACKLGDKRACERLNRLKQS